MNYSNLSFITDCMRGKSVAVVGNAKSLFDRNYGKEIDGHDFVIRFNGGFITKPECQGTKTNLLILAIELDEKDIDSFGAEFVINRCTMYKNKSRVQGSIDERERVRLKHFFGAQASTGFMAVDMCVNAAECKSITLYGFDWERTPTFYNPDGYVTKHKYSREEEVIRRWQKNNLVKVKE